MNNLLRQSRIATALRTTSNRVSGLRSYTAAMTDRIHRVTMFKMPRAEDQQKMIEYYRRLGEDNKKDGKPYILSMTVGPAEADPRSQGYTLISKTEFASLDDMKYYDTDCPAHAALKAKITEVTCEGIMTVYFKPQAIGGCAP